MQGENPKGPQGESTPTPESFTPEKSWSAMDWFELSPVYAKARYSNSITPELEKEWKRACAEKLAAEAVFTPDFLNPKPETSKPAAAPTEQTAAPPAVSAPCADTPEPSEPAEEAVIKSTCPPITPADEEEDPDLLRKMGKGVISNPVALDDLKKYLDAANAKAMKKALEDAKKLKKKYKS
jgi:hypothetical protein